MTETENSVRPLQPDSRQFFAKLPIAAKNDMLKEATEWLSAQGITYYQSRIATYVKDIEFLVKVQAEGRLQALDDNERYASVVNSLFESSDVISIYQGLHPIVSGHIAKRLREFVRGATFAHSESGKSIANRGRDFGFELYMASLCARAGYQLDFGTNADVIASSAKYTLILECKRPRFDHSLHTNVKTAVRQLTERLKPYGTKDSAFGIVCLSVERILNPKDQLAIAADENNLNSFLNDQWSRFARDHSSDWRGSEDSRLLGVLTLLRVPGVLQNAQILSTCRFLGSISFSTAGQEGHVFLSSVNQRLGSHLTDL